MEGSGIPGSFMVESLAADGVAVLRFMNILSSSFSVGGTERALSLRSLS